MAFFKPTSSERRGMIVLMLALLLIIGVGIASFLLREKAGTEDKDTSSYGFNSRGHANKVRQYYAVEERKVETFDFDPNEADSTALLRLGFAPYQVRGIYKYRAMGGRYQEPDDVRRVPGMTYELWDRISPHIRIGHKYQRVAILPRKQDVALTDTSHRHTVSVPRNETSQFPTKLHDGQFVSLNNADTTELKRIPGIGSYFARQIVRYREQLGGYVSVDQLQEIEGMPEGVERWLRLDTAGLRRIDVNHASRNQLIRHPYLRFDKARTITDRLHNFGPMRSLDDLRSLPNFTEADVIRLAPYLEFKD